MSATSNSGTSCAQATVDKEDESDVMAYRDTKLRSSKYLNNLIEQDHRGVKHALL